MVHTDGIINQGEAQHADASSEAPSKQPAPSSPNDAKMVTAANNQDSAAPAEPASLAQYHRENCVLDAPDIAFDDNYYYISEAVKMKHSDPSRMKTIVGEIASLRENLPEGIYVRYAESRPDVMKVLIIGPNDTPYEKGLFEFDVFCPAEYPVLPPNVQFKTTGHGAVQFNPNLYSDGTGKYTTDFCCRTPHEQLDNKKLLMRELASPKKTK